MRVTEPPDATGPPEPAALADPPTSPNRTRSVRVLTPLRPLSRFSPVHLLARAYRRTHFPAADDVAAHVRKIEFVRVAVGLVVLWRFGKIFLSSFDYLDPTRSLWGFDAHPQTFVAFGILGLGTMFTLGFVTPVATLALAASIQWSDRYMAASTLGTDVLSLLLLFFLAVGAGRMYSVDAWLAARAPRPLGWLTSAPYRLVGSATRSRIEAAYFLVFGSFALLNFAAFTFHQGDAYWQQGRTVEALLTNSYLSQLWEPMRDLQASHPDLMHFFSTVAVRVQGVWQVFMLALVFWRWGYWYVFLHGIVFFFFSFIILQLSYLPHLEVALWLMLFMAVPARRPLAVLYDDYCNMCKRTVWALNVADPFGRYTFEPLSRSDGLLERHEISRDAVSADIHGLRGDRVYRGYDLYVAAAVRNPLLWPVAPLLLAGRVFEIGPAVYRAVADRRRRLFGRCKVSYNPPQRRHLLGHSTPWGLGPVVTTAWVGIFVVSVLVVTPVLHVERALGVPTHRLPIDGAKRRLEYVGMRPPNVFNRSDLKMGDSWPVIYRMVDGEREMVPLNGLHGERLGYHDSDLLYFGNSLKWRRRMLRQARPHVGNGTIAWCYLQRVALYDARRHGLAPEASYEVEVWGNKSSNMNVPAPERHEPQLFQELEITVFPDEPVPERCRLNY